MDTIVSPFWGSSFSTADMQRYEFADRYQSIEAFRSLQLVCHRGAHLGHLAENSHGALARANQLGYGAEIDLRLTADGEVVLFHDHNLHCATGVNCAVQSITYAQLRSLRLWKSDERIPLLRDVFQRYAELPLLLDPKWPSELSVARVVAEHRACDRVIMIVHSLDVARAISKIVPDLKLCFALGAPSRIARLVNDCKSTRIGGQKVLDICQRFEAVSLATNALDFSPAQAVLESDKLVFGYRVKNAREYQRCIQKGALPVTNYYP